MHRDFKKTRSARVERLRLRVRLLGVRAADDAHPSIGPGHGYNLYSYGLYSCDLYSYGPYSYGLYSSGLASIVMAI